MVLIFAAMAYGLHKAFDDKRSVNNDSRHHPFGTPIASCNLRGAHTCLTSNVSTLAGETWTKHVLLPDVGDGGAEREGEGKVMGFSLQHVDEGTGVARWAWDDDGPGPNGSGGFVTGVWMTGLDHGEGGMRVLRMPDQAESWKPNGTFVGFDLQGVAVIGSWSIEGGEYGY